MTVSLPRLAAVPPIAESILKAVAPALIIAGSILPHLAQEAPFASTYPRHDFQISAERTAPEPGVIEVRACLGHAGVPVWWTGEPDSGWVAFGAVPASDGPMPGLDTLHEARHARTARPRRR